MSKKKYSGFLGDLSEDQKIVLQEFQEAISKDLKKPQDKLEQDKQDVMCLRYCRASRFNLEKSISFWENEKIWRAEAHPENVKLKDIYQEVKSNKAYYSGFDKKGRPVLIVHAGRHKPSESPKIIEMLYWISERAQKHFKHPIDNSFIVIDVKDFGWSNFDKESFKQMANIMMKYYVERLGMLYFVNASWITKLIWGIAKVWIDEDTKAKGVIFLKTFQNILILNTFQKYGGGKFRGPNWDKILEEEEEEEEEEKGRKRKEKKEREKRKKREKKREKEKKKEREMKGGKGKGKGWENEKEKEKKRKKKKEKKKVNEEKKDRKNEKEREKKKEREIEKKKKKIPQKKMKKKKKKNTVLK
ncbi:hypothetical protein M0813_13658 [Anaeramoeba flamelloides]|uniref:CRAL-TRIO domain-containing protein n=1 Tax=Anaeramoeba flamelloides TaxID=1746091 RepID=A0ABQ8Z809_9EUKA|nr:hypothetical protein M0813_13658 [Anaeramoeba flamelloides]